MAARPSRHESPHPAGQQDPADHAPAQGGPEPQAGDAPGRWPDFIGVGAIKAGTTWLHRCLSEHPEILTPGTKELHFFDMRFDRGEAWYRSFFPLTDKRVAGETTPGYLHDADAARRLLALKGTTRLVVSLRNPVDRAYSHFMMNMGDRLDVPVAEHVREFHRLVEQPDNKFVQFGFYHRQLRPLWDMFGAERIHIVLYDDIERDPLGVLRGLFGFLGVAPDFEPPSALTRINQSRRYRYLGVFNRLRAVVRWLEAGPMQDPVLRIKTSGPADAVLGFFTEPRSYPPMLPESRAMLERLYRDDVTALARLIGRDLSGWPGHAGTREG